MAVKDVGYFTTYVLLIMILMLPASHVVSAQLTASFYSKTCPSLQTIVANVMAQAVQTEARLAASILRLFFHDCFVQGCDGSILLDDTSGFTGEKTAFPNSNSVRGFDVIDNIKTQVEAACQGTVSCADILALAARDAVVLQKGPSWNVLLGRRDSLTASLAAANTNLPAPSFSLNQLIASFQTQGLSVHHMVALSGAHTIGQPRRLNFKHRLYNQSRTGQPDPTLDTAYLAQLKGRCPASGGDDNLLPLDVATSTTFQSQYYVNLEGQKGLLNFKQELFSTVDNFAKPFVTS